MPDLTVMPSWRAPDEELHETDEALLLIGRRCLWKGASINKESKVAWSSWRAVLRILHVFYSYLPDVSGASVRSAGLVSGQTRGGMSVVAVTSPFQPGFSEENLEYNEGLRIWRTHRPGFPLISEKGNSLLARLAKLLLFPFFAWRVFRVAQAEGVDVIHAHSTFYCGFAGLFAARLLGVGFVYEFRSLWEERARRRGLLYRLQATLIRWMESVALQQADGVVAICDALRAEAIGRGVSPERVDVVPNAVDEELIEIGQQLEAPERARRFGYVGSISPIEGLDLFVDEFLDAFSNGEDVSLGFFGGGVFEAELVRKIEERNDKRIRFHGRFGREDVLEIYRQLDCVVLPRRRSRLSEAVTPLKPLEAMAFRRLVCVSDLRALREVVGRPTNALFFSPEKRGSLARVLRDVYLGALDVRGIAICGNRYVREQRSWTAMARLYGNVYEKVQRARGSGKRLSG